jgi:hypothetical protein
MYIKQDKEKGRLYLSQLSTTPQVSCDGGDILFPNFFTTTLDGISGQISAAAAVPQRKEPLYQLERRLLLRNLPDFLNIFFEDINLA